jgi:hypothetical protein
MNKQEKKTFIKTYLKTLSNELLADISKMPETWSGAELRELVANRAKESCGYLDGARKREFENDCLINNI